MQCRWDDYHDYLIIRFAGLNPFITSVSKLLLTVRVRPQPGELLDEYSIFIFNMQSAYISWHPCRSL